MEQIAVPLDEDELAEVDRLVAAGHFPSRTAAVQHALQQQRSGSSTVLADPDPSQPLMIDDEAKEQIELLAYQARRVLALCYEGPLHGVRRDR